MLQRTFEMEEPAKVAPAVYSGTLSVYLMLIPPEYPTGLSRSWCVGTGSGEPQGKHGGQENRIMAQRLLLSQQAGG